MLFGWGMSRIRRSVSRASRRRYTAKYKLEVLAEYERLDKAGKGALLRREGLYTSPVSAWREQRDGQRMVAARAAPRMAPARARAMVAPRKVAARSRAARTVSAVPVCRLRVKERSTMTSCGMTRTAPATATATGTPEPSQAPTLSARLRAGQLVRSLSVADSIRR